MLVSLREDHRIGLEKEIRGLEFAQGKFVLRKLLVVVERSLIESKGKGGDRLRDGRAEVWALGPF